ncbi:hypothetical protein Ait01nite_030330 [Actinoplanes italicus]|uniref:Sigma-70-like protein n=1 Tax=Actinoplanes italicus TaxID=113567 RepID=A0A2T0KIY4_9ACTN|nr:hypothetical protein [Actinoplanes italicus]PRX23490.1 hypothetical protein CLV67_103238 [Actinoplanes italicus]GIE29988.1 hypothetical protein Ait01nite_030330 [Actinoplanes italicus]
MTALVHGYTLNQVGDIARSAVVAAGYAPSNFADRYDEAWSAVVETLYSADAAPDRQALWYAGLDAVHAAIRDDRRHYGASAFDRNSELASAPGFVRYWGNVVTPDFSSPMVERFAARQIWRRLSGHHKTVLATFAAAGTIYETARLLDVTAHAAQQRIDRARAAFRALWHEHETPSRQWRKTYAERPVGQLQGCGTTAGYTRHRRRKETACEPCAEAWRSYGRGRKRARAQAARVAA